MTELLLEQLECADVILINKSNLLADPINDLKLVQGLIKNMNHRATVFTSVCGKGKDAIKLLGSVGGKGSADFGVLDEHRMKLDARYLLNNSITHTRTLKSELIVWHRLQRSNA